MHVYIYIYTCISVLLASLLGKDEWKYLADANGAPDIMEVQQSETQV